MTITKIKSLESGMCAWIERHDIHVYCHNPYQSVVGDDGVSRWRLDRDAARYRVVAEDYAGSGWVTAVEAAQIVDAIVAGAVPAAA